MDDTFWNQQQTG